MYYISFVTLSLISVPVAVGHLEQHAPSGRIGLSHGRGMICSAQNTPTQLFMSLGTEILPVNLSASMLAA